MNLEVVDLNANSLRLAKERYDQIPENEKILDVKWLLNIDELNNSIDLAIISTNADVRFLVLEELLEKKQIKKLLLEKILFQELDEYRLVSEILQSKKITCWVNHIRREFPFYKKLKMELIEEKQIFISVQGGDWGLACNGLHFIDLLSYLGNSNDLTVNIDFLNKNIYQNKRVGFIEFQGTLIVKLGNHSLSLYSSETPGIQLITIASDNYRYIIDESNGIIHKASADNQWKWEEWKEKIVHFQSEITHRIVEDILYTGHCLLPSYNEAVTLHTPFIASLLEFYNKITNEKHDRLPIT